MSHSQHQSNQSVSYTTMNPSSSNPSSNNNPQNSQSQTMTQSTGQSPLDWTHFMAFNTPPGLPSTSGSGKMGTTSMVGSDGRNGSDQYQAFAQGIAMNLPPNLTFKHPFKPSQSSQQQYAPNPPPRQQQLYPQSSSSQGRSPIHDAVRLPSNSKGKSPVAKTDNSLSMGNASQSLRRDSTHSSQSSGGNGGPSTHTHIDNGLTLDPSAFSSELRFQVPPFLAPSMPGAPTFPPGGEAWSGYGGPHIFGGSSHGSHFPTDITNQFLDGQQGCTGSDGGQRNVLEGLSGFLGGEGGWENWLDQNKDGGAALTPNMGFTFYTNPNPTVATRYPQAIGTNFMGYQNPAGTSGQVSSGSRPQFSGLLIGENSSNQTNLGYLDRRQTFPPSPHSTASGSTTMPTSAILPQQAFPTSNASQGSYAFDSFLPVSNIASSSKAPYAPPPETHGLVRGATGSSFVGPSVADGPGLYSTTGFDMMGVLSRVANRKDPKTVLGPVDFSCSFLVVDIRRFDSPIVYASPTFSALTGYDSSQILGRNCRFLQSPEGEVIKGSKRKYTDNVAVAHLKRMLNAGKECQASLINYRRGGVPFINLVTIVPIPWDGTDIVYHVGFQVDLVEQPNAILRNMREGSYQVNYCVSNPPQPPLRPAAKERASSGLTKEILDIMRGRVKASSFGHGEEGGKMEWLKTVLENADDFVHVLSLKGSIQFVSPSVRRVLEYNPEDLVNKNMSDICHPSDIVPLMRELKDSTHAPADGKSARTVKLVFRIRRKHSGYIWVECTGRLHVEPGKGRKAVILCGRARHVPTLPWALVANHGGLGKVEFWCKLSFEGLILHATNSVGVLGQPTADVVGQSIFSLLPGGDNCPPAKNLELDLTSPVAMVSSALKSAIRGDTRTGAVAIQHKMVRKSGNQIDVISIFYPSTGAPSGSSSKDSPSSGSPTSNTSVKSNMPTYIIVQIKAILSSPTASISALSSVPAGTIRLAQTTHSKPVVHSPTANIFEELETTRGTSWQYELHQLRLVNRRLREDIATARAALARRSRNKGKKRKVAGNDRYHSSIPTGLRFIGHNNLNGSGGSGGQMGPPPIPRFPEQFSVAPKHQLSPAFGLVPPSNKSNIPFTYF